VQRIAINGFGRIGRSIAKINEKYQLFDLVLINDINPHPENLAYLFKYDSTYGRFNGNVFHEDKAIVINQKKSRYSSHSSLEQIPWDELSIDLVIDSSGIGKNIADGKALIKENKFSKMIVTNSYSDVDNEIIMGVNDDKLSSYDNVVSNSICDANAIAHIMKWLDEEFEILGGSLTTLHPWLAYQNLVDGTSISSSNPGVVWKDYALGRASAGNLIPKNTTAMTAVEKVLPNLKGKVLSFSYRIPTDIVASSDITVNLGRDISETDLKTFFEKKCSSSLYIDINYESLVSMDYEMQELSGIIDGQWLKTNKNVAKIVLWYDNEWGYSSRVLDLAKKLLSL
jgi:glyceraldehyde 3-phosphate dehydrogenase